MITLGTIATNNAHRLPWLVPNTGIAGEKANDNNVGANVFVITLVTPNINPRNAPIFGPNTIEAMITGIWIIVALMTPKWIKPSGVKANNKIIDKNIAVMVKCLTFFNFFCPFSDDDLTLNFPLLLSQVNLYILYFNQILFKIVH